MKQLLYLQNKRKTLPFTASDEELRRRGMQEGKRVDKLNYAKILKKNQKKNVEER